MTTRKSLKSLIWWAKSISPVVILAVITITTPLVVSAEEPSTGVGDAKNTAENQVQASEPVQVVDTNLSKVKKVKKITYRPHRRLSYRKFDDGVELWRKPDGTVRLVYPKSAVGVASSTSQVQN